MMGSGDPYQTRVQNLFGSSLGASAVAHDRAGNHLLGGPGQDWFWLNAGTDQVSGATAGKVVAVKERTPPSFHRMALRIGR
jgi:hypothetical protein